MCGTLGWEAGLSKSVDPTRHADPRTRPDPNLSFVSGRVRSKTDPKSVGSKRIHVFEKGSIWNRVQNGSMNGHEQNTSWKVEHSINTTNTHICLKKFTSVCQLRRTFRENENVWNFRLQYFFTSKQSELRFFRFFPKFQFWKTIQLLRRFHYGWHT